MTQTSELKPRDIGRILSRVHPLGAEVPELDVIPRYSQFKTQGIDRLYTRCLGVVTEWQEIPDLFPCPKLSLYSWSYDYRLIYENRTFIPGTVCYWHDPARIRRGEKPWKVTLLAVATEHVGRVLHLKPGLMVRLYNGTLMFALPSEVEL